MKSKMIYKYYIITWHQVIHYSVNGEWSAGTAALHEDALWAPQGRKWLQVAKQLYAIVIDVSELRLENLSIQVGRQLAK